ncbi:MAG: alpha/beta fold hydrolase BchO [Pseudomonadota bacterium]
MRWPPDPQVWPFSDVSRQVLVRPHRWHIQEMGSGPTVLLIHGAGGATQSFRNLAPLLAARFHIVMMDLPGQGFTQMGAQQRCGLDHMAEDLLALIRHEGWKPTQVVGHSAGTAIALRLWELGLRPTDGIVGINAALGQFRGVAGWLFPLMAKALAVTPFSASIFASTTTRGSVRNLIAGTGSTLAPEGLELYYKLATDKGHVDATLSMMAQWELEGLLARLSDILAPVHLIVAENDTAVPVDVGINAAERFPKARLTRVSGLGHLAHEEDGAKIAALI